MSWIRDNPATRWWRDVTADPEPADVRAPWRLAPRDWGSTLARTVQGANTDDYGIVASSIAFAAFLSLLPLLALCALAYSAIVPQQEVIANIGALVGIVPGDARAFVQRWLVHSLARQDDHGLALVASGVLTLFSARRVGRSLMYGINIASGIQQDRGPLATQGVALAIVAAGFVSILAALVSLSALAIIRQVVPDGVPGIATMFRLILWVSLTAGPMAVLLLTYRYAPARAAIPWRWAAPGMVLAMLCWVMATLVFGAYVGELASYGSTYGSLSAVVVLQLWLMLSAYVFLLGAKLNAEAMQQAGVRG